MTCAKCIENSKLLENSRLPLENSRLALRWSKITTIRSLIEIQYCFGKGYADDTCLVILRIIRINKEYLVRLYVAPEEYLPGSELISDTMKNSIIIAHKIMAQYNSGYFDQEIPVKTDGSTGNVQHYKELLRLRDKILGRISWRF